MFCSHVRLSPHAAFRRKVSVSPARLQHEPGSTGLQQHVRRGTLCEERGILNELPRGAKANGGGEAQGE